MENLQVFEKCNIIEDVPLSESEIMTLVSFLGNGSIGMRPDGIFRTLKRMVDHNMSLEESLYEEGLDPIIVLEILTLYLEITF